MAQQLKIDIVAKDKSKQALTEVRGGLDRLKKSVFSVQNAFIGLGAGLAIRSLVNTGKQIEGLQVRLKFLFGTASEGAKAFDEMAKFAAKVPFSLEEIQAGSGVLAVVSKDAKELANLMEITGNVAAVTGLDFKTTAEQIQRSMSAGISAADLFRDRGVKSMLGFKAGAVVSVEETAEAFTKIFGKGGKFGGATDELAKTFEGTLSMIGDKFFSFKRTILEAGFFASLKKEFGDLNKALEKNSEMIEKIGVGIGTVLAVSVEKLAQSIKLIAEYSSLIKETFKIIISYQLAKLFLNIARALVGVVAGMEAIAILSGPVGIGLAVAAAAAGTAAYYLLGKELDSIAEKIDRNHAKFKMGEITDRGRGMAQYTTISPKEMEAVDTFLYNYVNELEYAIPTATEKAMNKFKELNDTALENIKNKFTDIRTTIAEGLNAGITSFSNSLSRAIILGEDLGKAFKRMVQDSLVNMLAVFIEMIIRMGIQKLLGIELEKGENKRLNTARKYTNELQKQVAYAAILAFLTGGASMGGGGSPFKMFAKGGAVSKGEPILVGENGAEMFVPNSTGQITQSARGTGGGNGATTVNFNITTVDAKGFDQLLVERRGTISRIINESVNEKGRGAVI
jgi:hypothetical protein